jgi:hypothetical protein
MKLKSERAEPISDGGQKVFGLALVDTVDNHVIRVALEGTLRVLPVHPAIERVVHEQIGEQRGDDSSNAIANFEFDVALTYRRGEKPFRKPRKRSATQSDANGSM